MKSAEAFERNLTRVEKRLLAGLQSPSIIQAFLD
jgi:hypothetical protein